MSVSVEGLGSAVKGRVVQPSAPDYDERRALFNGMIDKRPAAIAYCVDEADVAAVVRFGTEQGLPIAIRGGGHNGAGLGSVDDGLVIDLSQMNEVSVDPAASLARAGGGALLKDLIEVTHQYALTVPVGTIGTTGVGGLTLGGGVGHLSRAFGLTIDNLAAATVVLADGSVVQTDSEREPDLFWAIRGGGGNFGIVTSFSFRCHPLTNVLAGPTIYDLDDAADAMRWFDGFIASAPDELGGWFAYLSVPPGPPFPEELHLRQVCALVWTQPGEDETPALREARSYGKPLLDGIAPMPFPVWNTAFDALYPPGEQWYWRGEFFDEISEGLIEATLEWAPKAPTWKSTMHMYAIDGAASRVANDDTAWAYRKARWAQVVAGIDPDPANAEAVRDWSRGYSDATRPYAMAGGYSNFQMDDEPDRVRGMYGANYDRLARIKAQYDPDNVFRVNQNIEPAA